MTRSAVFTTSGSFSITGGQQGAVRTATDFALVRSDIVKSSVHDHRKWRPPLPYINNGHRHTYIIGQGKYNDGRIWSGVLSPSIKSDPIPSLPTMEVGLRSRAEVGALLKLKDQNVNFGQAFGERAQTARLFETNIVRIAQAYSALRHGNLGFAADKLGIRINNASYKVWKRLLIEKYRDLAQLWLELQYGWKPLLQDIHGACVELDKHEDAAGDHAYRVTVKKKIRRDSKEIVTSPSWPGYKDFRRHSQMCFVRLDYIPGNVELARLASLGLTNPAMIAWELMPFSFIVDWAYPLGNWINALDAAVGWDFLGGSRSELIRLRSRRECIGPAPNIGVTSSNFKGSSHVWDFKRVVYSSSPIPARPGFKNPVSEAHVKNAMALLVAAFSGRRISQGF